MKSLLALVLVLFTTTTFANEGGHDNNALFPQPVADLTTSKVPEKTKLSEPSFYAKIDGNQVTLKWTSVADADSYHLQLATDANFKWLVADENLYKNTSFEAKNLEAGQQYFWRVAAVKSTNIPAHRKGFFQTSMFQTTSKK